MTTPQELLPHWQKLRPKQVPSTATLFSDEDPQSDSGSEGGDESDAGEDAEDGWEGQTREPGDTSFEEDEVGWAHQAGAGEEEDSGEDSDSEDGHDLLAEGAGADSSANSRLAEAVARILDAISEEGLTVGRFLEAFSWGDPGCTANKRIGNAHTRFLQSAEFPRLKLQTWWKPPRSSRSHKSRPKGGRAALETFAKVAITESVNRELAAVEPLLRSTGDVLSKDDLVQLQIDELEEDMHRASPVLWSILEDACITSRQRQNQVKKNPSKVILNIISSIAYVRSQYCNRLQRMLAVYFKFKGLTAKGCDTLHALGVSMSSKWTTNAVAKISEETMKEVETLVDTHASVLSYDNVYMTFRVFSQRLDKKNSPAAGTAATMYVKTNALPTSPELNRALKEWKRAGMEDPITALDVVELAESSEDRITEFKTYHVLQALLQSEAFDLDTYPHRKSEHFLPPPPVHELPCGPDEITLQYMLGTLPTPEATYEDNDKVIQELLQQLGCKSAADLQKISLERILFVVGDQLTVDRIRGLQRLLCQERNSYERLDFVLPIFGWLHFQMAFAKSLHKQYLGTEAGTGLKHAFTVLQRKGLDKRATQGPFHDNLEHALYDVLEAHLHACWKAASGVAQLKDLRTRTPEQLTALAKRIVEEYASTQAMVELENTAPVDEVMIQQTMFLRDVLLYVVLDRAIKHGDVGLMEGVVPHTLLRFAGGRNSNYTTECLELLQGLHREWPPDVREYVRKHCWLSNTTGKRDGFTAIDRAQEARIKDIKVTHRSQGPNVDWAYLKKLHPAIPVIQAVSHHVEEQFRTWTRYSRHSKPHDAKGINMLCNMYSATKLHERDPKGRQIERESEQTSDIYNIGLQILGRPMARWMQTRRMPRATTEEWVTDAQDGEEELDGGSRMDVDECSSDEE